MDGHDLPDQPGLSRPVRYPFQRPHPLEPPPILRRLRDDQPVAGLVLPDGTPAYVATRHTDVRRVLTDHRFSREAVSRAKHEELIAGHDRDTTGPDVQTGAVEGRTAYEHSTPYRLIAGTLSPRAVDRLQPRTRQIVDELLDDMAAAGPPADLIRSFARRLPAAVLGEVLGIPDNDRAWFQRLSARTVVFQPNAASRRAVAELRGYVNRLLHAKRNATEGDLCSSLVAAHDHQAMELSWETVITLILRVATAGLHSMMVSLGKGVPLLLRHPATFAALHHQQHGDRLVEQVAEELLRLTSPAPTALPRMALDDVPLGHIHITRGSVVFASLESANHDERRYPAPGRLSPERGTRHHLAFAAGPNYCIGAAMARMELQTAITALATKFPSLALQVPDSRLRLKPTGIAPEILEVPVSW